MHACMHIPTQNRKYSYYDISIIVHPFTGSSVITPLQFFSLFFSLDVKYLVISYTETVRYAEQDKENTWMDITIHVVME